MLTGTERADLIAMAEDDAWDADEWEVLDSPEPVIVQFELYPKEVIELDKKARRAGKTRSEYLRDLAIA